MIQMCFQHYKGNYYRLVCLARSSDDPNKVMVVYRAENDNTHWVREAQEFHECVKWPDGSIGPRFKLIKER